MQKSKKKKQKNFLRDFFPCGFPNSGDKKGGNSKYRFFRNSDLKCPKLPLKVRKFHFRNFEKNGKW